MIIVAAMTEIEPEHIDAGFEQCLDALASSARRAQGRDDLGAAEAPHRLVAAARQFSQSGRWGK